LVSWNSFDFCRIQILTGIHFFVDADCHGVVPVFSINRGRSFRQKIGKSSFCAGPAFMIAIHHIRRETARRREID
jgi:hypothetical protein